MDPYRTAAIERSGRKIMDACYKGDHSVRLLKVLCGGEGPDYAAEYLECARGCGSSGIRYCDGDIRWDEPWGTEHWVMKHPPLKLDAMGFGILKATQFIIAISIITALVAAGVGAKLLLGWELEERKK